MHVTTKLTSFTKIYIFIYSYPLLSLVSEHRECVSAY